MTDTTQHPSAEKSAEAHSGDDPNLSTGWVEPPQQQQRQITGFKWFSVVTAILSSVFLYSLDNTVVADIQPDIIKSLGEIEKLPWLSIAFMVTCVATNSIWGKIYTQFDAKLLYLICLFLFEVGSALCGAAPTMSAMIAGRVLAGLGGIGLYIGVMTLLSINTTEQERPTYIGLTGLTWGVGTVLGPIVGGSFADSKIGWRWAFYLNLFVAAAAAPVYFFMIPSHDPQPRVPYKERFSKLDYLGTILILGASVSGVLALNSGGVIYPWNDARTIACFVVSGVLFIVFGIQQSHCILTTIEDRTFPCHFLKSKVHIILFMQMAATGSLYFTPIYYVPLYFQFIKNDSPIQAGVRLLPLICPVVFGIITNGSLMSKYGYYTPWYLVGGCIALAGSALMYTVKADTPNGNIYGYLAVLGIGGGMYAQASFAVVQAKSKPEEIAWAVGFVALGQLGGTTISLAIANSLFMNGAKNGILAIVPSAPAAEVQGALSGAGSALFQTFDEATKAAALAAIAKAIGTTYILAITSAAFTLILVPFMSFEKVSLS
ncbi:MFS general substrate transporter [Periconia macrospinosa]|uniref:MFS general substrate transporter n=1 Tax=Periconia macrospinosa TaxID=97972 RepID=A0A2V1D712_9PLEO|nr:MFS general substrate transporter [Periconia macrospinosa]